MTLLRDAGWSFKARLILGIVAALLAAAALAGLLLLAVGFFGPRGRSISESGWLLFVVAGVCYFLLQFFAEIVLSVFWDASSWIAKAVPIAFLVAFYAVWFGYVA